MLHHICLASNQPVPNLTPVAGGHVRAAGVSIVTPPERQAHTRWLQRAMLMAAPGLNIEIVDIESAYDLALAVQTMRRLADLHPQGCVVNITGGSKILTLAAWQIFSRPGDRIFYVNPQHDAIDWLRPASASEPIQDTLSLPIWLAAHGLEPTPEAPPRRPDPQQLKSDYDDACRKVNRIYEAYRQQQAKAHHPRIAGEGGYWLERYLAYTLTTIFSKDPDHQQLLQDISGPFKVRLIDEPNVINELDGAVLYNNRLTIFEAKTGTAAQGDGAVEAIFRLSRLRDRLGGWISQGIFVANRPVSRDIKARAHHYGITIIDALMLPRLRRQIEETLRQPNRV